MEARSDPGDVADEPVRLLAGRAAPVEEVVGAAFQPGLVGPTPVLLEHGIEMIAAVGRLDIGEVGALRAQLGPVDVALPARNIDTVNGELARRPGTEIDRMSIAEAVAVDARAAAWLARGIFRSEHRNGALGRNRHAHRPFRWHEGLRLRNGSGPGKRLRLRRRLRGGRTDRR